VYKDGMATTVPNRKTNRQVVLRFSPADHDALEQAARENGGSATAYIKVAVAEKIERDRAKDGR
jgi:predicted HicB family RNase H-like nuclease